MKKYLFFAAATLVFASCFEGQKSQDNGDSQRIDSLENIIKQQKGDNDELWEAMNEIQEGFNMINEAEGRVNMYKSGAEGSNNAEEIRENMKFIQETLETNKKKIAELQEKMKSSTANNSKLQQTLENLTKQLEEKTKEIEDLRSQLAAKDVKIGELDAAVTSLKEENTEVKKQKEETEEIARNQDSQLNTAWYVFGTSRELKDHNILIKGNVLEGNYDRDYLTKIDIRKTTVIPFDSKSATLLTNHPAGSYTLLKDSNGKYTLRITDPSQFWSVSKYLVVKVK